MSDTSEKTAPTARNARSSGDAAPREVIARAAALLRALEDTPSGARIATLAGATGLPRTTVNRLVASLQAEQLVALREGMVRLGPALIRLARATRLDPAGIVRPHIEALARELDETVDLWVERESFTELVDEVESSREVRIVASAGFRLPLTETAPGRVFLSTESEAALQARLGPAGADAVLLRALASARETGIALDEEEHAQDVSAVAMAVDLGLPERYAIAIPAPTPRFRRERPRLEAALRRCVAAIEGRR